MSHGAPPLPPLPRGPPALVVVGLVALVIDQGRRRPLGRRRRRLRLPLLGPRRRRRRRRPPFAPSRPRRVAERFQLQEAVAVARHACCYSSWNRRGRRRAPSSGGGGGVFVVCPGRRREGVVAADRGEGRLALHVFGEAALSEPGAGGCRRGGRQGRQAAVGEGVVGPDGWVGGLLGGRAGFGAVVAGGRLGGVGECRFGLGLGWAGAFEEGHFGLFVDCFSLDVFGGRLGFLLIGGGYVGWFVWEDAGGMWYSMKSGKMEECRRDMALGEDG